ncbi:MAG: hypothetical protein HOW73_19530 [Polyangiaceae bacterium]|nr:hypothetical protein [Polyangiaceae bacterium]
MSGGTNAAVALVHEGFDPVLAGVPGLTWNREGMVGLSGPSLALAERLDASFASLARAMRAEAHSFVPLLAARDLRRADYFTSFPQLVTIPATLERDEANLRAFADDNGRDRDGALSLSALAPVETVLAPAACYSIYAALRGSDLGAEPRVFTTLGTCFRREERYTPLRRQWCFRMREVVHVGTAVSSRRFLEDARAGAEELARAWGIRLSLQIASDPFFDPSRSPKSLHQKLFPTKQELVCSSGLAIGSLNAHRNFFGETFELRAESGPAHSACLAFGLERWVYAVLAEHGNDPASWPGGPA